MSSGLMCVIVRIERESLVFLSAYGSGSEKSEDEKGFSNTLNEFVVSSVFGMNE